MDRPFLHLAFDEGGLLINLWQIVSVDHVQEDQITLHTSDGHTHVIHGEPTVKKLTMLLCHYAMEPDGKPFGLLEEEEEQIRETKGASES